MTFAMLSMVWINVIFFQNKDIIGTMIVTEVQHCDEEMVKDLI